MDLIRRETAHEAIVTVKDIAIYAVASTIGIYLQFTYVFNIRLPKGVL